MATVNVHETKTHFPQRLNRAHAGEEIIVAKAGKPFARLAPLKESAIRQPGRYRQAIPDSFYDPLPEEELEAWNR